MSKILRILGKRGRITVPFEIRQSCGFAYNDILSEKLCDGCCGVERSADDTVSLYDFLNGLSETEQHAALVHLSVKWAVKQGGGEHG